MKTTLTSDDPSGWYECSLLNDSSEFRAIIWDGKQMLLGTNRILGPYTNFRRLFIESDVVALNEELRTLREELCQLREKKAQGLTWVKNGSCLFADSAAGEMIVMPENGKQLLLVRGKSKARFPKRDAAKAHAEELHQQAWRELLDKWSAK